MFGLNTIRLGLALCGSYCTYDRLFGVIEKLTEEFDVYPIMSDTAAVTDSRFGKSEDYKARLVELTGHKVIESITEAEPIGPKKLLDVLAVAPCTGNTLAKLANGITDTAVTMAVKAHLRNDRPVVIGISTNDALLGSARNIGELLARKNYYFVPFGQDDPEKKPTSLVANWERLSETVYAAINGKQIQPIIA